MSSSVRLSVCLSSVTFMHPTQAIEIFGNVSTPFGTLAICDLSIKILRRSSHGNPSGEGLNQRGVAKYSDFGPLQGYISVTLNHLERRNRPNGCVISPSWVAFWADCVKVVEDTLILSAAEIYAKECTF